MLSAGSLGDPMVTPITYDAATGETTYGDSEFPIDAADLDAILKSDQFAGMKLDFSSPDGGRADLNKTVHGNDDRTRVTNTRSFPWRAVVKLNMQFPDGGNFIGSGAMVSPFHVLTAGHVIHSEDNGGFATSITAYPGQDDIDRNDSGQGRWYGGAEFTRLRTYTSWTEDQDWNHDWGLITLDRNIGDITGFFGYETLNVSDYNNGTTLNTAGYPGDRDGGRLMYRATGPSDSATDTKVFYTGFEGMDTAGGQSGSGVWRYSSASNTRHIHAIHAYGSGADNLNSGTRINADKFNRLNNWIAADASPTDRADLIAWDDWFDTDLSFISRTSGLPGSSLSGTIYPRNNGTAASAAATVSFYASTNTIISTADTLLANVTIPSLGAMQFTTATFSTEVPYLPEGQYYIGYRIDSGGSTAEFDESNNSGLVSDSPFTVLEDFNDQISEAVSVNPPTMIRATVTNYDADIYTFEMDRYQRMAIDVDRLNADIGASGLDSYVRVFDSRGNQLDHNDDGLAPDETPSTNSTRESYLEFVAPSTGTYYVGISAFANVNYNPITGDGDISSAPSRLGDYALLLTPLEPAPPLISGFNTSQTYDADSMNRVFPFDNAQLTDPDTPHYNGGQLRVINLPAGRQPADVLQIREVLGVTRMGDSLLVDGIAVGTVTQEQSFVTDVQLTANATPERMQKVLRAISFETVDAGPARMLRAKLTDGDSLESEGGDVTMTVINGTATPVIGGLPGVVNYNAGSPRTQVFTGMTITDFDTRAFNGGLFRAINLAATRQPGDRLQLAGTARVSRSAAGSVFVDGVQIGTVGQINRAQIDINLNADATPDRVAALGPAVRFFTEDAGPQRRVRVVVDDGDGRVAREEVRVNVAGGTAAPVIELVQSTVTGAVDTNIALAAGANVTDYDSPDFAGGTLQVYQLGVNRRPSDRLVLVNNSVVTTAGTAVRVNGVTIGQIATQQNRVIRIDLNGNATLGRTQAVLRAMRLNADGVGSGPRSVRLVINDGDGRVGRTTVLVQVTGSGSFAESAIVAEPSDERRPAIMATDPATMLAPPARRPVLFTTASETPLEEPTTTAVLDDEEAALDELLASTGGLF